ncbi:MAG: hypothetical protein ACI9TY_000702 [Alphaproteobacteria bacterium]|jgi:hypothetical protein
MGSICKKHRKTIEEFLDKEKFPPTFVVVEHVKSC